MALPLYVLWRLYFSIVYFLKDWYLDSFKWAIHRLFGVLEKLDKTFALKITVRHFFEPLYGDRTFVGYVMGFLWRTLRVQLAVFIYLVIVAGFFVIYLVWISIPPYLLYKIFESWLPLKIL